jgi:hypothetical protein
MRVSHNRSIVVLSRRNLEALLAKLDGAPYDSACTIYRDGVWVRAEENEKHYGEREPGEMHPETEARL